jgi:predicted MPP superfamily phosphohydrolase
MARPRRRNVVRFRLMVLFVVTLAELPLVATVAHLASSWLFAVALAAVVTTPFLVGLRSPFEDRPKSPLYLYLGLWPFFAWWASGLVLAVLAPLALGLAWALKLSPAGALGGALAVALLVGVRSTLGRPRLVERDVSIPGLPFELDGYRIAQISDVHCGSYTPESRVASWVERLNALDPDLVAVTGDLITSGAAHVESVARALGGLRGRDGVFACLGNHDYFTDAERLVRALEGAGVRVLRNHGVTVVRETATLFVAGVDDTWTGRADVARAIAGRPDGAPTVLLAHDPNLFPQAAEREVELVLSGHTHGGQLAVPWLSRRFNLARLVTPFSAGLYRLGRSLLYVNRGAGTTGPPVRLGAAAELTLLTLRSA